VKRAGPVTGLETLSGDEFKRIQADLKRITGHIRSIDPISADFPKQDMPTPDGLVTMLKSGHNDIVKYALVTRQDLKPYEPVLEKMLKDVADGGPDEGVGRAGTGS
jgi:hypothetical protein